MTTVTFDTLKYARQLEATGMAPAQAEAFVITQRDILSDVFDMQVATKTDIVELKAATKADIAEAKTTIIMWVVSAIFLAQLLPSLLRLIVK